LGGHRPLRLRIRLQVLAEESKRELAVVNTAALVFVIAGEELEELILGVVHAGLLEHSAELFKIYVALVGCVEELKHFDEAGLLRHLVVGALDQLVLQVRLKSKFSLNGGFQAWRLKGKEWLSLPILKNSHTFV